MLWLDKHTPRTLDELKCHAFITELLKKLKVLGQNGNIPHLLFYGPPGTGKKTRIMALLRGIFGPNVDKITADNFVHKETSTELVLCQSSHHLQLSCPTLGTKDRVIIQGVIKELQSHQKVSSFFKSTQSYRVFVFNDAEVLSQGAQAGLRRTVEKHARTARVFLHVNRLSNIIAALRSRCLCIRIPVPSVQEMRVVLRGICDAEHISPGQASDSYLDRISSYATGNLRRAILILENAAVAGYPGSLQSLSCFAWEDQVEVIVEKILKEQSPRCLADCRDLVYEVLTVCIPSQVLLETLVRKLLNHPKLPSPTRKAVFSAAAHYSHTMSQGDKPAFHIEAFSAHVMASIKQAAG